MVEGSKGINVSVENIDKSDPLFLEGYKFCERGGSVGDCPYKPLDGAEAERWILGFLEAQDKPRVR